LCGTLTQVLAPGFALVVEWVRKNIKQYKGNPDRILLWFDSAGNGPVSTYAARPEIAGTGGAAVKGVVLMSPPNFNILPETVPQGSNAAAIAATSNLSTSCGRPAGEGRGGRGANAGGRGAGAQQADAAKQMARSNLKGLATGKIAVFLAWGELDSSNILSFDLALKGALCKAGRCPATGESIKNHSHISLVLSPNTADDSVTGPILKWMKSVN
jgi:hypothetical protein